MIIISLATGLYYVVRPVKRDKRVAQALTTRISISVALFLIITFAAFMGWFKPTSLLTMPKVPLESSKQIQKEPTTQNPQNASTKQLPQKQNDD